MSDQSFRHRGLVCFLPLTATHASTVPQHMDHSGCGNNWYNEGLATDPTNGATFNGSSTRLTQRLKHDDLFFNPDLDMSDATAFGGYFDIYITGSPSNYAPIISVDNAAGDIQWRLGIDTTRHLKLELHDGSSLFTRTTTAQISVTTFTRCQFWWSGAELRVRIGANSSNGNITPTAIRALPDDAVIQIGKCENEGGSARWLPNGWKLKNIVITKDSRQASIQEAIIAGGWTPNKLTGPTPVWSLIGQSNAAGRNYISDSSNGLRPASLQTYRRGDLLIWENGEAPDPASTDYEQTDPFLTGGSIGMRTGSDVLGPEAGLLTTLPAGVLIKVTKGSTAVHPGADYWYPGDVMDVLWKDVADDVIAFLEAEGMDPYYAGTFIWQGLSDTISSRELTFGANRSAQIASARTHFGWHPWFEAWMKETYDGASWPETAAIRTAQTGLVSTVKDFYLVDMDGTANDSSHEFANESYEGGRRFGLAYQQYVNKQAKLRYPIFQGSVRA